MLVYCVYNSAFHVIYSRVSGQCFQALHWIK